MCPIRDEISFLTRRHMPKERWGISAVSVALSHCYQQQYVDELILMLFEEVKAKHSKAQRR